MVRLLIFSIICLLMFSCLHVKTQKKLTSKQYTQIEAILNEANDLMEKGFLDEALKKTTKALKISASYQETREMRKEIKRRMKLREVESEMDKKEPKQKISYAFIDSGVSGILFRNIQAVEKILGKQARGKAKKDETRGVFWIEHYNSEESEILRSIFDPAENSNSIVEFEIRYVGMPIKRDVLSIKKFITTKGVTLGITKNELVSKIGKPSKKLREGYITEYEYTTDVDTEAYWVYYGKYKFEGDKLIKIRFGYEATF